jgi:hypothetical protein
MSGKFRIIPPHGLLTFLCAAFCWSVVQATSVEVGRSPGETNAQFVKRVTGQDVATDGPGDSGALQMAKTASLVKGTEALVAFTKAPNPDEGPGSSDNDIAANVFVAKSGSTYVRLGPTVACEVEGGEATLRAFFYADVGEPPSPHLAAICGWDQTHAGADCPTSDEVRFLKIEGDSLAAVDMEKYKSLFYKEVKPSKSADYTCTIPKFKTARDVKTLLANKH